MSFFRDVFLIYISHVLTVLTKSIANEEVMLVCGGDVILVKSETSSTDAV